MNIRIASVSVLALLLGLSATIASADTALSVSCSGSPTSSSITWTANASGGVAPYALLWGNGATSSSQTLSYTAGTYSMTIQATDASSTVATSTCAATVSALPVIASFTATPASITLGQSTLLAWSVSNASSTSINHGVGEVTGSSKTVTPNTTTTYTLTAINPAGTSTASVTVSVGTSGSLSDQIKALLAQIRALQQQIAQLIALRVGTVGTSTSAHIPPGQVGKAVCIALNRDLHQGDHGDDVKSIQEMLEDEGFDIPATGFFGPLTAKAMMQFQIRNGIASLSGGFVGPLTRGFFERRCGKGLGHSEVRDTSSTTTARGAEHEKLKESHGKGKGKDNDSDRDD